MSTLSPRNQQSTLPLACIADAIPAGERAAHFELAKRLFTTAVLQKRVLSDGYAYRFWPETLDDLAHWMNNERRCCPFLRFALELEAGKGDLWLSLTGPDGTHTFLDAELPAVPGSVTE